VKTADGRLQLSRDGRRISILLSNTHFRIRVLSFETIKIFGIIITYYYYYYYYCCYASTVLYWAFVPFYVSWTFTQSVRLFRWGSAGREAATYTQDNTSTE
jgi:hypothetical protein